MPYKVQKRGECYRVINEETGKKHSKCTTEEKAKKQLRILRGVESGKWKPATSYKEFVSQQFKKRPADVPAKEYMKEVASRWRQIKGKGSSGDEMEGYGSTLLLQPGLGQTSAKYVGAGATLLLQPGLGQTSANYTRD